MAEMTYSERVGLIVSPCTKCFGMACRRGLMCAKMSEWIDARKKATRENLDRFHHDAERLISEAIHSNPSTK